MLKDISKKHKIDILPVELKKETVVPAKPVTEEMPQPEEQAIWPEPEKIEIKAPATSIEPVFENDAFEFTEDDLEIIPDHEDEAIEVIAEAEPLEETYEPELMSGWGALPLQKPRQALMRRRLCLKNLFPPYQLFPGRRWPRSRR